MAESKSKVANTDNMSIEQIQKRIDELQRLVAKQEGTPQNRDAATVSENERRMREEVEVRLFKDNGKYKDDVFVAVNGKSYQIRRGVTVRVPRFVKEVLDSSIKQDEYAAKFSEKMAEQFARKNGDR